MISKDNIHKWETEAAELPDSVASRRIMDLCSEVRSLQHQLEDPNHLYASGRIHRQAIICRDGEISRLRKQVEELISERSKNEVS